MNWSAVLKGFYYIVQAIVAPTPVQLTIRNALPTAANEDWLFLKYCAAYPRLKQLENANVALAVALGATATIAPSGHVITISPPTDPSISVGGRPSGTDSGLMRGQ